MGCSRQKALKTAVRSAGSFGLCLCKCFCTVTVLSLCMGYLCTLGHVSCLLFGTDVTNVIRNVLVSGPILESKNERKPYRKLMWRRFYQFKKMKRLFSVEVIMKHENDHKKTRTAQKILIKY
jgi:hypothetical protein